MEYYFIIKCRLWAIMLVTKLEIYIGKESDKQRV
jgi:hypothetical protein